MFFLNYLILLFIGTVIAWLAVLGVLYYLEPSSGLVALIPFYASLFLALFGSFALVNFLMRVKVFRQELIIKKMPLIFRQSLWFSLLLILSLWFKSRGWFSLLNVGLLIGLFALAEFLCLSFNVRKR